MSASLKRATKEHERAVKLIMDTNKACLRATTFFEEFFRRKEKPYKRFRYSGEPVETEAKNLQLLKECTDISRERLEDAVSSAATEFKAAFANPANIEFKDIDATVKKYARIFFVLAGSAKRDDCKKFRRLFVTEDIISKLESLDEEFRGLKHRVEAIKDEKEINEILAQVKAEVALEIKEQVSKMAQAPSGAPGRNSKGGGRTRRRGRGRARRGVSRRYKK
jgi:hypothetical protein